jgi:AraC family transcriptional regulator of adaptative response/methylated-DNA-[protein]-cysteine methyltransferase
MSADPDLLETTNYQRIERVLAWIDAHWREQPSVAEMAAVAGLSPSHFHRLFRRFAGITPKGLVEFLTAREARQRLMSSASVLDAALGSGLSGPGRLHDLMVTVEGATPGQIQQAGRGMRIDFGVVDGPFGPCLIGQTDRGVCTLDFVEQLCSAAAGARLAERWPQAELQPNPRRAADTMARILTGLRSAGGRPRLDIRGSNFQLKVWDALLRIPPGRMISYGELARAVDMPGASRAVGTAVGANPVPLLIPCHRVLRRDGDFGQYSGGIWRKRAILLWEQGQGLPGASC